jgi:nucleotide-binding universal stress UspA family protein
LNPITSAGRVVAPASFEVPFARHPRAQQRAAAGTRHIAVFIDRSPEAANAAWRGALVARDRGLPLHLVALQPLHANLAEAAALADSLASQLRGKLELQVCPRAIAGTREHEGVEATRDASLLVLPCPAHRGLWAPVSPVLRMLRRARRPVLLARTPGQMGYRRVLAAVELGLDACSLIAAARALSRDPGMKVLHVLDTSHEETMRLADVPERVIREQRERDALRARGVLADLIASAGARGDAQPIIGFGNAGHAVTEQQLATGADLLVVGKRPRPALVDALRGGVAQRALRSTGADVLVLPMPPRAPTAAWHLPDFARPAAQ